MPFYLKKNEEGDVCTKSLFSILRFGRLDKITFCSIPLGKEVSLIASEITNMKFPLPNAHFFTLADKVLCSKLTTS